MAFTPSPEFQAAADASKKLLAKPSADELLKLYSLYKQVTDEKGFAAAKAPGTFDFKGKAKYNAWKEVAEAGTSPEDAQKQYIELVEELKTKYGYDENKVPETVGDN
ncbi:hypothetical protein ASPWEDRAFT_110376 [Aspergillus wentii DTO 134E9]|uniref:ACB domain-containing protein n=1 Tax=Aspergillus wentii DTO 134E9 TaxID=1073089 RepID=A0A1L9RK71_ASPWE|nr:uncharacterized protein ASPWEDRAFT_110376 [Aspergillus wentii DTO 134E9]KAI9924896.1 hypothetical protein MW887_006754 [Aspergillus wentii]OJJ35330.1 hypothetical protein ASPWEDRAFT_110376 [Aspergillus wentii DTO 134E9]